jgi:peptide/nickel transport system ATP-binding protein
MNELIPRDFTPVGESESTAPVLRIQDLEVSFRTGGVWRQAVTALALDVGRRETVALVGESGSGKSVTALSIMRLLPPANSRVAGRIELNGRDLMALDENAMRAVRGNEVSMVFQEPMTSLNPTLTIGFQIAEVLRWHYGFESRRAARAALELLEQVRIPNARERFGNYPHQFSGGMRQRVMIAMALACRPSLLIADEPTTALDVTIQAQILDLIRVLQAEIGMSVLFITHDMGVVAEIADRVVVMYGGEKVEESSREAIFHAPAHAYTRVLLDAVPRLGAAGNSRMTTVGTTQPAGAQPAQGRSDGTQPAERQSEGALLRVSNLSVRFDVRSGLLDRLKARVHAVENVSFAIAAGETLAFVGESGCGKSTIGRSLVGLVPPIDGSILFEGQEVSRLQAAALRAARRRMQIIFQDPFASLDPRQTVGAAIAEPMLVHGLADRQSAAQKVGELLDKVGLDPAHAARLPHEFSGGQRQRICIARALALEPRLIVADEAVSALDVSIRARVIELMMQLQNEIGLAYLFISHDLAVVDRIAHRTAVLYLGEIVEIGPTKDVLQNPQHSYTRRLLEAVPRADVSPRRQAPCLNADEIPSPIKPLGFTPPSRSYREVSPEHFVQVNASIAPAADRPDQAAPALPWGLPTPSWRAGLR